MTIKTFLSFLLLNYVTSSLFFEIAPDRPRCYIEELFDGSVMMVKWRIKGIEEKEEAKVAQFLHLIQIQISAESTGQILKREYLKSDSGKIAFKAEAEGFYKICVSYHGGWSMPYNTLMNVKINSDNMDEPKIEFAIKSQDLNPVHQKATDILDKGHKILERQKDSLSREDHFANLMITNSKNYYYMTLVQVLVIVGLGVYQIFNFKKFLDSNDVI